MNENSAKIKKILLVLAFALIAGAIAYWLAFSAPGQSGEPVRFIIASDASQKDVADKLAKEGFIKHAWAFDLIHRKDIVPGGYKLQKNMSAFTVSKVLGGEPYMKWITIPEGLRKEEVAELIQKGLGWTDSEAKAFIAENATSSDMKEGVYFPDTYLIPLDESTSDVAKRLIRRFNEVFAPYAEEALAQDIRWPTAVKVASLVQREAAGKSDMPLIAGVIWNRLEKEMKLDIDATLQYARGNKGQGWWAPLSAEDKKLDSPYNTYIHKGLPPTPISNPGLQAIDAALHPKKTDCFYYLHDASDEIHCAATFDEHKKNIEKYLKS